MGRRSRKRGVEAEAPDANGGSRAERDAARRARATRAQEGGGPPPARRRPGRTTMHERPPALWAPFPLTELLTLAGIVLMAWGLASGGGDGNARIAAGLAVASLGGLELSIREHVTGFRSHTTLLASVAAGFVVAALVFALGVDVLGVLLTSALAVGAAAFWGLRELFKRRSGGLSFR